MTTLREVRALAQEFGELIARQESRSDPEEFRAFADRPRAFMEQVLGFVPWSKQEDVIRSVLDQKRTVVQGHHGAGKDAVLAALLLWATYSRDMLSIVVSATERQLLGQVWAEVSRLWTGADLPGSLYVGDLRIAGEKRIVAMTSGSTSNLTGWHNHRGTGVFVAISESQAEQVGEAAFDAAEGNTAGEGSRIVVVGNPVRAQGRFYQVSRKPTWSSITISAFDHPNVQEGRRVIPGGPAPGWPEEIRKEYGEDSAFYVSRVLGEFPPEGSVDGLIRAEWLDGSFDRHEEGEGHLLRPSPAPVLALDVARSVDRDESVVAVVQGSRVVRFHAWRIRDTVRTAERFLHEGDRIRLEHYAKARGCEVGETPTTEDRRKLAAWLQGRTGDLERYVDSPGVGGGVVDVIRNEGRPVSEYWGWGPAYDDKRFANIRAEIYWLLRTGLQSGTIDLPRDPLLREELLAIEWSLDGKQRVILTDKELLRKRLGRSPDRSDAAVIGLAGAAGSAVRRGTVAFEAINPFGDAPIVGG